MFAKVFDEKVIFEANLSISVKPQQYAPIFVCSTVGIYAKGENISPFFSDTPFASPLVLCLMLDHQVF
jgi:hypothetical protein